MTTKTTVLTVARAEALFTSRLATGSRPTYAVAEHAIRTACAPTAVSAAALPTSPRSTATIRN